jgi:hypothetical protein
MKKTIIVFLCGILTSFFLMEVAVRVISPLLGPPLLKWNTMEDAKTLKLKEFKNKYSTPGYVLMGNSTVLIGFNPSVFDKEASLPSGSSFNAAMNGSEIKEIRDFACSYILREVRPKNLVILFSNSTMAVNTDFRKLDPESSIFQRNSYVYRYRNTFRDPMTVNTLIRVLKFRDTRQGIVYRWADNLDEFGYTRYATTDDSIKDSGWNPKQTPEEMVLPLPIIDKSGLRYLEEIRDLARAKGVGLIIGTVPTLSYDPSYRFFLEQVARYLGVGFVQGNDAVGQGKYFQDGVHLNNQGAIEFSKFLARTLLEPN